MTDAPPPSIPPRSRPTAAAKGDIRTVRRVPGQAPSADDTVQVDTGWAPGSASAPSSSTGAARPAGPADGAPPASVPPLRAPRPVTRPLTGDTARPASGQAARAAGPSEPVALAPEMSATASSEAVGRPFPTTVPPAAAFGDAPWMQGTAAPAPMAGSARPSPIGGPVGADAPDGEDDTPSPLMEAVDRSTVWLKKTAGAAGAGLTAAYSSLTRPRPQEAPMTANPTAPATSARTSPVPPPQPMAGRAPAPGAPRRVRLAISRLDPWSVMKLALLLSFALGIIFVVATAVVWLTLDGLHVFASVNDLVKQIVGPESAVNVTDVISFRKVISGATLIAVIDVFLLTAMATIGAFLYNIVAALVGGVHVTMTDE